jgi:hypothetical protein
MPAEGIEVASSFPYTLPSASLLGAVFELYPLL